MLQAGPSLIAPAAALHYSHTCRQIRAAPAPEAQYVRPCRRHPRRQIRPRIRPHLSHRHPGAGAAADDAAAARPCGRARTPPASSPAIAARRWAASTRRCGRRRSSSSNNQIHFQPGVNEDLAATAVWGTQQTDLFGDNKYDGVFAMWYGKGPGVDRSGDVLRHGNLAGTSTPWRRAGAGRRRPHLQVLDHGASERIRLHGRDDPGAEPVGRAGDPRSRPAWLGDVALFRLLGRRSRCVAETVDSSASVYVDPQPRSRS